MTVLSTDSRNEYISAAAQTVFNFTFKIFVDTDLAVYVTPSGQDSDDSTDLTTGYVIDPGSIGVDAGGFFTLNTPLNAGDKVSVVSDIPYNRTVDYQNNGDFLPNTVNGDNDRQVAQIKQILEVVNKTVVFGQSSQNTSSLTLPNPVAGKILRWLGDLSGLENIDVSELGADLISSDQVPFVFSTLAQTIASTDATIVKNLNTLILNERSTGNGGGSLWKVVLTSSVTPNTRNIVQSVGLPTLSFVQQELARPYGGATVAELVATDLIPGQKAITIGYYDGWAATNVPEGAATYSIATLQEVRDARVEPAWVPDEYGDHTMDNGYILVLDKTVPEAAKWGVSSKGVAATNLLAMQAAVDSNKYIQVQRIYDLNGGEVTLPAGARISGVGKVKGSFLCTSSDTKVKNLTIELPPASNGGNMPIGVQITDASTHTTDNVTFITCGWRVSNSSLDTSNDYQLTNSKFEGAMTGADFAVCLALGNAAGTKITGNTFKQTGLYRILKGTATGFVDPEVVTNSFSKKLIFSHNLVGGSIRVGGLQVIDIYTGLEKMIVDTNIFTITGGEQTILAKVGTGPFSPIATKLIVTNNVIVSEALNNCIDLQGAYGQASEAGQQTAILGNNSINTTNAIRAVAVRGFHQATLTGGNIESDDGVANYIAIDIRANKHATITGGTMRKGIIFVNETGSDPEIETVAISGVTILEQSGRGVDISGLKGTSTITIGGGCIMDSAIFQPVRANSSLIKNLIMVGNSSTGALAFQNSGSTITKLVDISNGWN